MLVKVREWISSALASPDLVLEAQPPAQPHSRVVVEHPIRFAGGSNAMTAPIASGWSESPGGPCTHWTAPPFHGARRKRSFRDRRDTECSTVSRRLTVDHPAWATATPSSRTGPNPDRRRHGVHLWLRHYSRRRISAYRGRSGAADADSLTSHAAGYVNSVSTATLASCFHIDSVPI